MDASVKIMLSYDYNHFEIALSEECATSKDVDALRIKTQRLADRAVEQYQKAKEMAFKRVSRDGERLQLERKVDALREIPESERTPEQKATIKALDDTEYWEAYDWRYEDDEYEA